MLEIKLILCPIDFSEFSVRAYRHALSLAEHYRARLVVQHVVELWRYPSLGFAASADLYDGFCEAMRENGMEQLQKFVKDHHYGEVRPELVVQEGMAPDFILALAAAQKADAIVMGTHGRRRSGGVWFDHLSRDPVGPLPGARRADLSHSQVLVGPS